jgi:hypothetical protein
MAQVVEDMTKQARGLEFKPQYHLNIYPRGLPTIHSQNPEASHSLRNFLADSSQTYSRIPEISGDLRGQTTGLPWQQLGELRSSTGPTSSLSFRGPTDTRGLHLAQRPF